MSECSRAHVVLRRASGMHFRDQMKAFIDRMIATRVAPPAKLIGCTTEEVAFLEKKYGLQLPASYALFLQAMGHRAGNLVSRDEFDLYYPEVLRLTEEDRAFWATVKAEAPN